MSVASGLDIPILLGLDSTFLLRGAKGQPGRGWDGSAAAAIVGRIGFSVPGGCQSGDIFTAIVIRILRCGSMIEVAKSLLFSAGYEHNNFLCGSAAEA
jgi:hypothetical protein